jgi:hypothetical protein
MPTGERQDSQGTSIVDMIIGPAEIECDSWSAKTGDKPKKIRSKA